MTLYKWSQTQASNATADPFDQLAGRSGAVQREQLWARDDGIHRQASRRHCGRDRHGRDSDGVYGLVLRGFDTLTRLSGQIIAFTPHATNGATVTLNVDSLGARPLRSAPSTELLAGTLIQGTPYAAALQ